MIKMKCDECGVEKELTNTFSIRGPHGHQFRADGKDFNVAYSVSIAEPTESGHHDICKPCQLDLAIHGLRDAYAEHVHKRDFPEE